MAQDVTLAFIFNDDLSKVLLVHKQRPDWQKGRINAVGGKIEPYEEPLDCIKREVREETGLDVPRKDWIECGEVYFSSVDTSMYVFTTQWLGDEADAVQCDHEEIEWFPYNHLPPNILTNLTWLVPLCREKFVADGTDFQAYTTFRVAT